jgi:4-hydroxy-4-methyl-2-oxoglutarate aldolase
MGDDPRSHRGLGQSVVDFLRTVDSATVANAIETFKIRDRCVGYIGGTVKAQFPDLGVMVGRALTVTMTSAPGDVASRAGYWKMWDQLNEMEAPTVLVIADASGAPHRVAYAGEIMATLAKRLGAVGIVTDGALRDVPEVHGLGIHYFMRYAVASHGNFQVLTVGTPVEIAGNVIETGDVLHGDINGVVHIPDVVLDDLPDAVAKIRAGEQTDLDFIRSDEFTLQAYKSRHGY